MPKQSASVPRLPASDLWDLGDAEVRFGGGLEARQAGAPVGALGVSTLPVLTQGHLVTDVLTLVDVCREEGDTG